MNRLVHDFTVAVNTLSVFGRELGGGHVFLSSVLPRLMDMHPECRFVLIGTRGNLKSLELHRDRDNVLCHYLPEFCLKSAARVLYSRYRIPSLLARLGADVYFEPYGALPVSAPCPVVWTCQNLYFFHAAEYRRWQPLSLVGRVYERIRLAMVRRHLADEAARADAVVTVSNTAATEIADHLGVRRSRVHVAPLGVSSAFTPSETGSDRAAREWIGVSDRYVLSVGALAPNKNLPTLIEAFAQATDRLPPDIELVLTGSDWWDFSQRLRRIADHLGIGNRVRLVGHVDHDTLPALYRGALMTAIVSSCESFCLPAVEAMACGSPLIAAACSGLAETVGDGARLVDPHAPDDIAAAMWELSQDSNLCESYRTKGIERARAFNWDATATAVWSALAEAVTGYHGRTRAGRRMLKLIGREESPPPVRKRTARPRGQALDERSLPARERHTEPVTAGTREGVEG